MLFPFFMPFARLFLALYQVTFNGAQPVRGMGTAGVPDANVISVQGVASGTAVPVSGTFWQGTQPVSGTFWQSTQPVSAAALPLPSGAAQEHTAAASPSAVRLTDGAAFFKPTTPSDTQPVSAASLPLPAGAATAAKQPAIGTAGTPSADVVTVQGAASMTALKTDGSATTQPVSGTFWQATQPVSGTMTGNQGTAAALSAAWPTKITDGTNTMPTMDAAARKGFHAITDGTNTAAVKAASTAVAAADPSVAVGLSPNSPLPTTATASSNPLGAVSLGNSAGKTAVMKTGALASSAATADQVILTYTVTAGKTLYVEYIDLTARLTTYAGTATLFGAASLEIVAGTKMYTIDVFNAGAAVPTSIHFAEPIPVAAGTVIRWVCTPSATTAMSWKANFGGYEK